MCTSDRVAIGRSSPVPESLHLGPTPVVAVLEMSLGVALLAGTTIADPVGRLLLLVAGLAALVVGLRDLLLRPVLTADAEGLSVVDGWTRRRTSWTDGVVLGVVRDRRTPLLSIDAGDRLVVLSRRRLGADPAEALAALDALRR